MFLTQKSRVKLISAFILQSSLYMHSAIILEGDSVDLTMSFSHPIKEHALGASGFFYVAANQIGAKNFAIATTGANGHKFYPLAPEKVVLENNASADNPLFDAQIDHMTLMYGAAMASLSGELFDCIAAVKHSEPATIYLIDSILSNRIDLLAARDIKDATGVDVTQGIVNMTSCNDTMIYAAVKAHDTDIFGQGPSGIAAIARGQVKGKEDEPTSMKLGQLDTCQTSSLSHNNPRAAELNNQSPVLHVGNSTVSILNNSVDLHWCNNIHCLYTALTINAQGAENEGGQAIAVGAWGPVSMKTEDNKEIMRTIFVFRGLTFPSVFAPNVNNIVGGIGSNINVSIHQIRSLLTTTVLNYLVILGGLGMPNQTRRMVYALPLVKCASSYNGMLAKKDAIPRTFYHSGFPSRIDERGFIDPATNPGDLFTADDSQVQVGHGPMTEGDITHILTYNDAVYALVPVADQGHTAGIFHSQALFDNLGRIKEWTSWSRVGGNFADHIFGAALNQLTGNFFMLTGNSVDAINTVKSTIWAIGDSQGSLTMTEWLNSIFPTKNGGIQGLYDIPVITPGLNHISLLIATGPDQVALVQTGIQENGIFIPFGKDQLAHDPVSFENGAIDQTLSGSCNAIALSGGALKELGIIKTATITRFNNAGYLFVGGTNGLAVLVNAQGYSWDTSIGLGNNMAGLAQGTEFKQIGSYKFIRKLFCDDEQGLLYVVSDTSFDCINIQESNFITGKLSVNTLAAVGNVPLGNHDTILDAVASRSLGIIATSIGLFRNGPHTDVRTATTSAQVGWEPVNLPEGLCTAKQILSITQTGRLQDLTTGVGGNIFILDTDQGRHQAMVHRFTINTQGLNEDYQYLIEEFPDIFIKDIASYFVQFAGYRTWIYSDGSLFFQERDKNRSDEIIFTLLPPYVLSGLRFGGNKEEIIPISLQGTDIIQPIVRSSASGSWLLARNNMLSVNE